MSDSDDALGGCISVVVGGILLVIAVAAAVIVLSTVGSLFGAGTAARNYFLAFRANVKPEGVPS